MTLDWIPYAIFLLIGVIIGRLTISTPKAKKPAPTEDSREILVKRTRPSFRDPGRTIASSYERYKTKDGLLGSVKPGKGNAGDEVEKR